MFEEARPAIQAALNELRTSGTQTSKAIAQAIRFLNQWPLAHVVEMRRRNRREKNFFLHYGVLGSDWRFDLIPDPQLATELHDLISAKFADLVDRGFGGSPFGKRLLRVAGWLYLAMPQPCYAWLRQRVGEATRRGEQLTREELHAIGLAFEAPDDLRPFFSLLVRRLAGVGTVNEWLRATRNISRFRNHALAPHIIATETLLEITRRILSIMRQEFSRIALRLFHFCSSAGAMSPTFSILTRRSRGSSLIFSKSSTATCSCAFRNAFNQSLSMARGSKVASDQAPSEPLFFATWAL